MDKIKVLINKVITHFVWRHMHNVTQVTTFLSTQKYIRPLHKENKIEQKFRINIYNSGKQLFANQRANAYRAI